MQKDMIGVYVNPDPRPNRQHKVHIGAKGMNSHSVYALNPELIAELAKQQGLNVSTKQANEFAEQAYLLQGADGALWQVLEAPKTLPEPVLELKFNKL